jgi:hypothetical protein
LLAEVERLVALLSKADSFNVRAMIQFQRAWFSFKIL